MRFLYNISLHIYNALIHISASVNPKAKLWVNGRKNIFKALQSEIGNQKPVVSEAEPSAIIWFHCASLGEFEQGRPLMENIRKQDSNIRILLTFFSPSGYEIRKNFPGADFVFYLPIDTPFNVRKFIEIVNPKSVFFIKYEFWFNYLTELKNRNIPTYLVSGIFRQDHYFFKWYGRWFQKHLNCFTHFYLQDEASEKRLRSIGFNNTNISGDTRFDRVAEIAKSVKPIDLVEQFIMGNKVLIVGSSWVEDEKIISSYFATKKTETSNYKLIIAPHEVNENHIQSIIQQFGISKITRYSQSNSSTIKDADVLIIDNIGLLSSLYQYGTIAFIGGGFGKGIHNILEAATFGLPIMFGPNYQKFKEASELIQSGGAFCINDVSEFEKTIELLSDKVVLQTASFIAKNYIKSRIGATDKILNSIDLK